MANRLMAMGVPSYENGFELALHDEVLELPLSWKKPRRVFVNSMSDLFHKDVPEQFILKLFAVMRAAPQHCFQILTKRSERLLQLDPILPWADNVWMGVSVETCRYQHRIAHLRETGAAVKFLSLEPLLGPLPALELTDIDWVIVGGESGPGARPMKKEWVIEIRDQCLSSGVAFFFKQWGGVNKKRAGRLLDGQVWDQFPSVGSRISTPVAETGKTRPGGEAVTPEAA